jgi:hypothetical protein
MIHASLLLRRALLADGLISGAMGLLLAIGYGALSPFLLLPESLLLQTGLFCVVYGVFVGWLGARDALPRPLVWLVIIGNALWTLGSLALLVSGAVSPNVLGVAFVMVQAVTVGVFAELQYLGLRRSAPAQAA